MTEQEKLLSSLPPMPKAEDMFDNPKDKEKYKGWEYKDIPRCSKFYWDYILNTIIGYDNWLVLAGTETETYIRGQVLISPEGMEKLKQETLDYVSGKRKPPENQDMGPDYHWFALQRKKAQEHNAKQS